MAAQSMRQGTARCGGLAVAVAIAVSGCVASQHHAAPPPELELLVAADLDLPPDCSADSRNDVSDALRSRHRRFCIGDRVGSGRRLRAAGAAALGLELQLRARRGAAAGRVRLDAGDCIPRRLNPTRTAQAGPACRSPGRSTSYAAAGISTVTTRCGYRSSTARAPRSPRSALSSSNRSAGKIAGAPTVPA